MITVTFFLLALIIGIVHSDSNEASKAYLAENAKNEDVITLPSGLQYKILKEGTGTNHPSIDSDCSCHYEGTLIDGTKFDSSYDRGVPATFAPNQVIKGWTEAMQLMVEGDKWEMYIPSELGYGDHGSPPKIPGGDALIFTMELIKIMGEKVPAVICDPATLQGCNEKEVEYVKKANAKFGGDPDFLEVEINRIRRIMDNETLSDTNQEWGESRLRILNKLMENAHVEDEF